MSVHSGYDSESNSSEPAPPAHLSEFDALAFKSVGNLAPGSVEFQVALAGCIEETLYRKISQYISDFMLSINKSVGKQPGGPGYNNSSTKNTSGKKIPFSKATTIKYEQLQKEFPNEFVTEYTSASPPPEKEIIKYISNFPFHKSDPATMFALTASVCGETAKKAVLEYNKAAEETSRKNPQDPPVPTWEELIDKEIRDAHKNPNNAEKMKIKGVSLSPSCIAGMYARQHCYVKIQKRNTISKNLNELFDKIRNKFDPDNTSGIAPPTPSLQSMTQQRPTTNNVFLPPQANNPANVGMNQGGPYRQIDPMQQRNIHNMMPPQGYQNQHPMYNNMGNAPYQ